MNQLFGYDFNQDCQNRQLGRLNVKLKMQNKIIYTLFFATTLLFISRAWTQENCSEIWGIESITVKETHVILKFGPPTQVGDINNRILFTTVEDFAKPVTLNIGQTVNWGDGDHAFYSLKLIKIIGKNAVVAITEKHRPPATHLHLKYKKTRKCVIK